MKKAHLRRCACSFRFDVLLEYVSAQRSARALQLHLFDQPLITPASRSDSGELIDFHQTQPAPSPVNFCYAQCVYSARLF
jgi:hypothetical protein